MRQSIFKDDNEEKSNDNNKLISLKELQNMENVISVCGNVYDISSAEMVYDQFGDFPRSMGMDISVAIAKNDFSDTANFNQKLSDIKEQNDMVFSNIFFFKKKHNKICFPCVCLPNIHHAI